MDLGTLVGIISGVALIVISVVLGGSPALYWNAPAFLIVIGGTIATTFIRFPVNRVVKMLAVARNSFFHSVKDPDDLIEEMVEIAKKARKEGFLSLEDYPTEDAFLKQGLEILVDGFPPEDVQDILSTNIRYLQRRHKDGQDILKSIGEAAPAFGMIGTLIGLVAMLANMSDVKALGPAMAVAILTTLYGAILANVIALPIAKKLEVRSKQETMVMELVLVGLMSIQKGDNPRSMEMLVKSFLSKKETSPANARPKLEAA